MRRHMDEDETPAAVHRRRINKAADARHGFGSPLGMELTDRPLDEIDQGQQQQQQQQRRGRQVGSQQQKQQQHQQYVRSADQGEQPQDYQLLRALVDFDSPPPPIDTLSTESETPTPPGLTQGGRQTPPDFSEQLVTQGRSSSSPPRDPKTPAAAARPPPYTGVSTNNTTTSRRRRGGGGGGGGSGEPGVTFQQGNSPMYFVSPTPPPHSKNVSKAATPTPTPTTTALFRPNTFASPMALQALRSPAELPPRSVGGAGRPFGSFVDPIQMGTPSTGGSGYASRLSDVTMTPDRARKNTNHPDSNNDSASDSDTSVKEPFSDQVKSLNKLLLSTDKRLGTLGYTSWSPVSKDNDDLTQEEEDLEEIRRQLQEELSMVDFSVLKDSPTTSGSGSYRSRRRIEEDFPDDEPQMNAILSSRFSTPDRSQGSTPRRRSPTSSPSDDPPLLRRSVRTSPLSIVMTSAERRTISPHPAGGGSGGSGESSSTMSANSTLNGSSQGQSSSSRSQQSSTVKRVSPPPPRPPSRTTRKQKEKNKSPPSKENVSESSPTTEQEQRTKKSPPSARVLVPPTRTLQQQKAVGNSPSTISPPTKVMPKWIPGSVQPKQFSTPITTTTKVEDAATEISHETSNQSSSSGSGSSARSSKSLLERFGFRSKSATSPLVVPEHGASPKTADISSGYESSGSAPSTGYGDAVSTSASEDSTFEFIEKRAEPWLSPQPQDTTTISRVEPSHLMGLTPISKSIRRFEEQLDDDDDSSPKKERGTKVSPTLRREIAPEPPSIDIQSEPTKRSPTSYKNSSAGSLRAQGLLNSLDSLFLSKEKKQTASTRNLLPKSVERSDTANSLTFPSDERKFPPRQHQHQQPFQEASTHSSAIYASSVAIPSDEREFLRANNHPPVKPTKKEVGRLGSQSSIGNDLYPSDEKNPTDDNRSIKVGGRSPLQLSVITSSTAPFPNDERGSSQTKKAEIQEKMWRPFEYSSAEKDQRRALPLALTPDNRSSSQQDSSWLLQNIGSIGSASSGKILSPIVHEDEDPDRGVEIVISSSESATKVLFSSSGEENTVILDPTQLQGSYSGDAGDRKEEDGPLIEQHKTKSESSRGRLCILPLLVFGAGVTIFMALFFTIGMQERIPSLTASPSVSLMPSATPTIAPSPWPTETPAPIRVVPTSSPSVSPTAAPTRSPSIAPTRSPTKFTVSFESVYEIIVLNGQVENVPQVDYESDLIESMDRLLLKIEQNLPSESNRLRRRLQIALLPSTINDFVPTSCPKTDSQDRCERVFAWITLEDAEDTWAEFKLTLELAIAIGQLQFELNQVNPDAPVAIIDLVAEPGPTLAPTQPPSQFPTSFPPPTEFDLLVFLKEQSFDGGVALLDEDSSQYRAYVWLSENARVDEYPEYRLIQRYALATFYFSTHGENWFFQELWLSNSDECLWYSRSAKPSCNKDGQIENLELDYNNVNGELPPELGLLSNSMERLVLRGGPASFSGGTIPSELGFLTKMTHFFIRGNLFTGTIPTELGGWTALEQFDVSRNNLSGPIPTQFGSIAGLSIMDLSTNKLTGEIPTELGNLERCQRLNVQSNMLTGAIPSEIGSLRRLQSFHGGSNMLSSSMPTELGRLTFLDTLSLYENELSGTIPTEISRMRRLLLLELSNNELTGAIPSQLGNLFDMRDRIDLSFNHLTGTLPSELGSLNRLRLLELQHNKLSGTIPPEIAGLVRITTIRIDANDLTGSIPTEVCAVFNRTYPAFSADCSEFLDDCPCCTTCCVDDGVCECRYIGTPQEFLCFQQKKAI